MRTPPDDLDVADLTAVLAVEWGLTHAPLRHAPVGFGGHHWLADVAGRPTWFVTAARPATGTVAAFETAVALRDAGLEFVVAPVTTELGAVIAPCRGYVVSLTPWLPGATDHAGSGSDVVAMLGSLHAATAAARGVARSDDLTVEGRAALVEALARPDTPAPAGPYADDVRSLLATVGPRLRERLAAHDAQAAGVDRAGFVVTHGEVKPGNLLVTPDGPALVDWDTALLAPPERDLWRLPAADLAAYAALTGRDVDPDLVAFYRQRWDLTDVALYVAELRTATARTADTDLAWSRLAELLG